MRATRSALFLGALAVSACDCEGQGDLKNVSGVLSVEPASVDFGEVLVGDFRVKAIKVSNKGDLALALSKAEIAGPEFTFGTTPPATLAPAQTVTVNLFYSPANDGEDTGAVTLTGDDGEGPKVVQLHGVGVRPGVRVTSEGAACAGKPGSIDFGRVTPGGMAERTITIEATGGASIRVIEAARSTNTNAEFRIDPVPAEGVIVDAGKRHTLTARYAPIDGGPDTGTYVIKTDVAGSEVIEVPACGEGVAPAICVRPSALDLGPVTLGSTSTGSIRLESCGTEPLVLTAAALAMDPMHPSAPSITVTRAPMVPATLQPGATLDVPVELRPTGLGPASAWLRAASNAAGAMEVFVPITGRGAQPCDLSILPSPVSFSNVMAGASDERTVLVANDGASACNVSRLEITSGMAQFTLLSPPALPLSIASGGSVMLRVRYTASAGNMGDRGVLTLEEGGMPRTVDLLGNPMLPDGCQLEVMPTFVNFGAVPPGTMRTMGVTVTNLSDEVCRITRVELDRTSSPDFQDTAQNTSLLLPNRNRTLTVTYRPTSAGSARGEMVITTTDVDSPTFRVPLFATAAASGICVDPRRLPFGDSVGLATLDFRIYACGTQPVTVTALDWTTPDAEFTFQSPPALPFTLQPGGEQRVTVAYRPVDQQGDTAVITVRSNDAASPAILVEATGGREIVPSSAGRYLYFWQISNPISGGDIVQLPLQGMTMPQPYWGPRTGKACAGCHSVSPDGRYVALTEAANFRMIDTQTGLPLALPMQLISAVFMSWKPDVNTNPPYQFVYDDGSKVHIASLFAGALRELQGANDTRYVQMMPTWGSDGRIAFVRGTQLAGGGMNGAFGIMGACDVMTVPEGGGVATPLMGASLDGAANYYPTYSPNARWIAFTVSPSASTTIVASDARLKLVRADNSGTVLDLPRLNSAQGDGASSYPTWSVDGRFLSFSSNRAGGQGDWDLYIAPVDTMTGMDGPAVPITQVNSPRFEHVARWSP